MINKQIPKKNENFSDVVKKTNIFKLSNSDLNIITELKKLELLYYSGGYHQAVSKRIEIYQNIYSNLELEQNYFPRKLAQIWTAAIGHEALIGSLQLCAKYSLVPDGKRVIEVASTRKKSIFFEFCGEFIDKNFVNSPIIDVSHFPSQFHKYENLMLWRTKSNSFEDQYPLVEKSFKKFNLSQDNSPFIFSPEQDLQYYSRLHQIGLPKNSWFVVIHVKETPKNSNSRRSAKVQNYLKACNFLISQGGWVIQVGFEDSTKLDLGKNFIDLRGNNVDLANLHLFVMAKAFFYLGTITGFNVIAGLFKTPSLITNAVTLGRNTIAYSPQTRYIPKTVLDLKRKKRLRLNEILSTSEGFGDPTTKDLLKQSMVLIENSSEEIYEATVEFYNLLRDNNFNNNLDNEYVNKLNKIRSAYEFCSSGMFMNSYLDKNSDWLDNE
jgi:putative glycosyltransferase (TIGR04372 family)